MKVPKHAHKNLRVVATTLKPQTYDVRYWIPGKTITTGHYETITRQVNHAKRMKRLIRSASTREEVKKRIDYYLFKNIKQPNQ
jgi:hypothetical protein